MLGKYPADVDAYVKKRNRRIVAMYKMMNQFEEEDAMEKAGEPSR